MQQLLDGAGPSVLEQCCGNFAHLVCISLHCLVQFENCAGRLANLASPTFAGGDRHSWQFSQPHVGDGSKALLVGDAVVVQVQGPWHPLATQQVIQTVGAERHVVEEEVLVELTVGVPLLQKF